MGQTNWLNPEEMRAWRAFLAAGALVNRRLDQQLKQDVGLSHPQYEILVRLSAAPDRSMRMTELADGMLNSKSRLTYQVTQLEQAGLVCRGSCADDERGVIASLTDAGLALLERAAPGHVAAVRAALIDVLTPEQVSALADGLGEVTDRLSGRARAAVEPATAVAVAAAAP